GRTRREIFRDCKEAARRQGGRSLPQSELEHASRLRMRDLDNDIRDAVRYFWAKRAQQSKKQGGGVDLDRGARTAVTGGKQLDGFIRLAGRLLVEAKVPESCIAIDKRIELPGWFRAEKQWD